jgi:uncharacterized caspase-like protein
MLQSCGCGQRLMPSMRALTAIMIGLAFALAAGWAPGVSGVACAQSRVALVIGNSAYAHVPSLPNPAHDARDVADALKRLDFAVDVVTDADFDHMRRSLLEFGRKAKNADMAVLYFAGHGVEIEGNNWLLPTDVELKYDADASTEAIALTFAVQAVAAKTLGLVILDACRNNPFKSSMKKTSQTRNVQMLGLAPVEPVGNVLVAYAARDGTVANDGTGRNSPYSAALLRHLETPGLEIDFLFRNVRDDVMAATDNEQQPWVYGSLSSQEIYLKPPPAVATAVDDETPPDAAEIAWSFLLATNDSQPLKNFVRHFPGSTHVPAAQLRIASLDSGSLRGAGDALPARPVVFADSEFERAEKAVARRFTRDTPAIDMAWAVVRDTKDHTMIRRFVNRYPSQKRETEADTQLAALGQKPFTVHAGPQQPLEADDAVLVQAAADPDVHQCFRRNDQSDEKCRQAFARFPDISRYAEDIRFTVPFCQGMGSPSGCIPTVKAAWNFPSSNSRGVSSGSAGAAPSNSQQPAGSNGGADANGPKSLSLRHRMGRSRAVADAKGAGVVGTDVKANGIRAGDVKISGASAAGKTPPPAPAISTPAIKTPDVKIKPPDVRVNVRVPNIDIRVH